MDCIEDIHAIIASSGMILLALVMTRVGLKVIHGDVRTEFMCIL